MWMYSSDQVVPAENGFRLFSLVNPCDTSKTNVYSSVVLYVAELTSLQQPSTFR